MKSKLPEKIKQFLYIFNIIFLLEWGNPEFSNKTNYKFSILFYYSIPHVPSSNGKLAKVHGRQQSGDQEIHDAAQVPQQEWRMSFF